MTRREVLDSALRERARLDSLVTPADFSCKRQADCPLLDYTHHVAVCVGMIAASRHIARIYSLVIEGHELALAENAERDEEETDEQ